jgi:Legume lectin domain
MPDGVDLRWTTPTPPALSGPGASRFVWVTYQNTSRVMKVFYSATSTPPASPLLETILPTDLSSLFGGQVYFGVTAGTGSCYSKQYLVQPSLEVLNIR